MRIAARLRTVTRRPPSELDRWSAYLARVEPALGAVPRIQCFARSPTIGEATARPSPVGVWIEGDVASADFRRTLDSLIAGPMRAAVLRHGPLTKTLADTQVRHLLLVAAGDVLAPLALERFGQAVSLLPDALVVTCDEDERDVAGTRVHPHFRPCPSPDRWLACDDTSRTLLVDREAAAAVIAEVDEGPAWRHELALRLTLEHPDRAAHVPLLLGHRASQTAAPALAAERVEAVLGRTGAGSAVDAVDGVRRVRRAVIGEPSVEVIICLRDRPQLLARCMDSLLHTTAYERLGVCLVDNGSVQAETHELLARLERDPRVRVVRDPRPFNFSALNNGASKSSEADVLVFLNNDTEVVQGDWVEILLQEAMRPEVGAVAPMLLFPDQTVQHAGAALGLHGYAGHPFAGLGPEAATPFGYAAQGTRNWLAVTAACMMIRRDAFDAIGGFDETFIVAGNDVDLCLRLTRSGRRSLCVPHVVLIHHESQSRGSHIDPADFVRSQESYGEFRTVGDPFYNPNLTLDATDCSVRVA